VLACYRPLAVGKHLNKGAGIVVVAAAAVLIVAAIAIMDVNLVRNVQTIIKYDTILSTNSIVPSSNDDIKICILWCSKKGTIVFCEMKEYGNHCPMEWAYWILEDNINYQ
jgi:hypothetical protein